MPRISSWVINLARISTVGLGVLLVQCGFACARHPLMAMPHGWFATATGLDCDMRTFIFLLGLTSLSIATLLFAMIGRSQAGVAQPADTQPDGQDHPVC